MRLSNCGRWLGVAVVLASFRCLRAADETPAPVPPPPAVTAPAAGLPTGGLSTAGLSTAKPAEAYKPPVVVVQLLSGDHLNGTLAQAADLPMRSSFGEIRIPYSEIAGIRLAREGSVSSTVVLHNGDTVTGAVTLDTVTIETDWGKAEVNGSSISSLNFVPATKWVSENGMSGTRWKLVADEPPKNTTAQGANQNRAANNFQYYRQGR